MEPMTIRGKECTSWLLSTSMTSYLEIWRNSGLNLSAHTSPLMSASRNCTYLAAEVVRAGEERHQHVGAVVVEVARELASGEEDTGTECGSACRAAGRRGGVVVPAEREKRVLADVVHVDRVVPPRVRFGPPLTEQRADVDLGVCRRQCHPDTHTVARHSERLLAL